MTNSDWIALAACVAAIIGLIPAFAQMFSNKKTGGTPASTPTREHGEGTGHANPDDAPPARTLNGLGRALVLSSFSLAFGVIEIVLFSRVAEAFGIAVDLKTMPLNWTVVFYGLFVIPGIGLFMAFAYLTSMFE